jgi:hypothetical protein
LLGVLPLIRDRKIIQTRCTAFLCARSDIPIAYVLLALSPSADYWRTRCLPDGSPRCAGRRRRIRFRFS